MRKLYDPFTLHWRWLFPIAICEVGALTGTERGGAQRVWPVSLRAALLNLISADETYTRCTETNRWSTRGSPPVSVSPGGASFRSKSIADLLAILKYVREGYEPRSGRRQTNYSFAGSLNPVYVHRTLWKLGVTCGACRLCLWTEGSESVVSCGRLIKIMAKRIRIFCCYQVYEIVVPSWYGS